MGFAPAQARQALAKTSTGVDVQEALDLLLGGAGPSGSTPEVHDVEYDQRKRQEAEKERRRRRRAGPSRESVKPRTTEQQEQDAAAAAAAAAVNAQEQAERILAQASEIGQSMFNKATLFWNTSKERAIKVYEEQRKVLEAAERGEDKKREARPKWMQDEGWGDERMGGFRDGDDEQDSRQTVPPSISQRPRQAPSRPSSAVSRPAVSRPTISRSSPSPQPKPTPLPARPLIPATAQQLESSAAHKTKGNDHFKLGRFTEAESSYSSAIAALPAGNLFLIPLLNNRATTRLKLGDSVSAAADCTAVIDLVGIAYHPGKEASLPAEYAEIKLGDGLSKALVKRAQAWEMGEKWKAALEDWERVMGLDAAVLLGAGAGAGAGAVAKMRNMAVEGARRARKMMESGKVAPAPATATPTPTATPTATPADVNRSAAVADLSIGPDSTLSNDNDDNDDEETARGKRDLMLFSIMDGHAGDATSSLLQKSLHPTISDALAGLQRGNVPHRHTVWEQWAGYLSPWYWLGTDKVWTPENVSKTIQNACVLEYVFEFVGIAN